MKETGRTAILLTIVVACSTLCAAQKVRYFKAEHGVGATYVKLGADGRYSVIDREHMGVFLTDEGHWQQAGAVVTFKPANSKKASYQATEVSHGGKVFLAITSDDAEAGIVIPADDTKKALDTDPSELPDHVLFKITAKTYNAETKETYPFRYIDVSGSRVAGVAKCDGTPAMAPNCWRKLDAGPFSVLAPLQWEFRQLQGVDSYVGEFVGDGVTLTFDFGRYASGYLNKAKEPAYIVKKKSIAGHSCKLVSTRTPGQGITGMYCSRVRGRDSLCIFGKNLTSPQQKLAMKIFETIGFGGDVPRYVIPPPPPPPAETRR